MTRDIAAERTRAESLATADYCPKCGTDLRYKGPGGFPYRRTIGIYSIERDRTAAWRCPDCGYEEAR